MKFKLFFLLLVFSASIVRSQSSCGKMGKNSIPHHQIMTNGGYQAHDTCLNKKLSIVFHIVLDSNNVPVTTPADLATCITNLNTYFKRICITFMNCSTNYIPNYNYNRWEDVTHEPPVFANYYVDSTINIYLVESINTPSGTKGGYAYIPGGPDAIVLEKAKVTTIQAVHEMGFFFGLPHTFDGPSPGVPSIELVNESNCSTTGDLFCDTEADCYPAGENTLAPCHMSYGPKDANNNFYTPPVDNIMTHYEQCRCRFTQQQYNHMAYMYYTYRNYLH